MRVPLKISLDFYPDGCGPDDAKWYWHWYLADFVRTDEGRGYTATDREAVAAALASAAEIQAREYDSLAQSAHDAGLLVKALAEAAEKAKG